MPGDNKQPWWQRILMGGAVAEAPSIMTAAGHKIEKDGTVTIDNQNDAGVKQLRSSLPVIGSAPILSVAATNPATYPWIAKNVVLPVLGGEVVNETTRKLSDNKYNSFGDFVYHNTPLSRLKDGTDSNIFVKGFSEMLNPAYLFPYGKAVGYVMDGARTLTNAYNNLPVKIKFTPRENFRYRNIGGKDGLNDLLESGVVRAKQKVEPRIIGRLNLNKSYNYPYFGGKGKLVQTGGYEGKYFLGAEDIGNNFRRPKSVGGLVPINELTINDVTINRRIFPKLTNSPYIEWAPGKYTEYNTPLKILQKNGFLTPNTPDNGFRLYSGIPIKINATSTKNTNFRNVIFNNTGLGLGKNKPGNLHANDTNSVYRVTGRDQIEDIILNGYVRPKPNGKVKGGHRNEVHWAAGEDNLFYYDGRPVIQVNRNMIGNDPVSIDDIIAIYEKHGNEYINVLDKIKQTYKTKRFTPNPELQSVIINKTPSKNDFLAKNFVRKHYNLNLTDEEVNNLMYKNIDDISNFHGELNTVSDDILRTITTDGKLKTPSFSGSEHLVYTQPDNVIKVTDVASESSIRKDIARILSHNTLGKYGVPIKLLGVIPEKTGFRAVYQQEFVKQPWYKYFGDVGDWFLRRRLQKIGFKPVKLNDTSGKAMLSPTGHIIDDIRGRNVGIKDGNLVIFDPYHVVHQSNIPVGSKSINNSIVQSGKSMFRDLPTEPVEWYSINPFLKYGGKLCKKQ